MTPIVQLIYHTSILITVCVFSDFVLSYYQEKAKLENFIHGIIYGLISIIAMLNPYSITNGIFIDGRSVILSLCALFYGPIPALISGAIAITARFLIGGSGTIVGVLIIIISLSFGLISHKLKVKHNFAYSFFNLFIFGIIVHILMLAVLYFLPDGIFFITHKKTAVSVILIFPLASVIVGKLIANINIRKDKEELLLLTRATIETASDSLFWIKPDSTIVDVNIAACKSLGYSRNELLKLTVSDIDVNYNNIVWYSHFIELRKNGALKFESAQRTKKGVIIPVEIVANYVNFGNKEFNCAFVRDISERKTAEFELSIVRKKIEENEKKLMAIADQSAEGIALASQNGKLVFVNQAFSKMTGYSKEELLGSSIFDLLIHTHIKSDFLKCLSVNVGIPIQEKLLRKDHSEFVTEIIGSIIKINGDDFVLGTVRDITDRINSEKELENYRYHLEEIVRTRTELLNETNEELLVQIERQKEYEMLLKSSLEKEVELSEMKSRFISTTSHEFRTPLTSVLSSTELLQRYGKNWKDSKRDEHFNRIISSVEYLTNLLDDVLTISRTESGKISFKPEQINLLSISENCIQDSNPLKTLNHSFFFNYLSSKKDFFLDPKLVRFILNNLLSNAYKYSPNGGSIELIIDANNKDVIIEVKDQGIGIPKNELSKIFESFYRTKSVAGISGTGLGLAIIKRAVDLHGGELFVESELGCGTVFTIKLPIVNL